jgi:deoxyribose-phosphate aldolase
MKYNKCIIHYRRITEVEMMKAQDIAKMIDHSLLRPELTVDQVKEGCRTAREYNVATVCVKPCDVVIAKNELVRSNVLTTTVIGFPHGSTLTEVKVFEAEKAIRDGAVELDMVMNYGRLLSGDFDYVKKDIMALAEVAHKSNVIVKVILENCYLSDELKETACRICEQAGADFVKTSTGFGSGGATIEDLKLMRRTCSEKVRVKAAGGVRTLDGALAVRAVGTVRFGATATKIIMDEAYKREAEGTLNELTDGELKGGY